MLREDYEPDEHTICNEKQVANYGGSCNSDKIYIPTKETSQSDDESTNQTTSKFKQFVGIFLGILAGSTDAFGDFETQVTILGLNPSILIFYRCFAAVPLLLIVLFIRRTLRIQRKNWPIALANSVSWSIGNIFCTYGMWYLPLFLVVVLIRLKCVFGVVFSFLFLKQKLNLVEFIVLILITTGVAMTSTGYLIGENNPKEYHYYIIGCILMLGMAIFIGLSGIFCNMMPEEDPLVICMFQLIMSSAFCAVYLVVSSNQLYELPHRLWHKC